MENKWIGGLEADKITDQYNKICETDYFLETAKKFTKKERLDDFWTNHFDPIEEYSSLNKFFKMVIIMIPGNAFTERGFSINKEILITNLSEPSLIAQRIVHDAISIKGGISKVEITKSLIQTVRKSRSLYEEALKEKKKGDHADEELKNKVKMASLRELTPFRPPIAILIKNFMHINN